VAIGTSAKTEKDDKVVLDLLARQLKAHGLRIDPKAALSIRGELSHFYLLVHPPNKAISTLSLVLTDRSGRLERLEEAYEKDLKEERERNEKERETKKSPPDFKFDGCKVTLCDSKYAVEMLVQRDGKGEFRAVAPTVENGRLVLDLKEGDAYKVRLHNASKWDAAARVRIDRRDTFQNFQPQKGRPTHFLVPAKGTREIKGWPLGLESVQQFRAGSLPNQAAKTLEDDDASPTDVVLGEEVEGKTAAVQRTVGRTRLVISICCAKAGSISISFSACWEGKKPPPELEEEFPPSG
jgi:hypothetical protein